MRTQTAAGPFLTSRLTEREREVLELLARGFSNQQIADCLTLALTTVKWYARQINTKLDAANRQEAVARAAELGLVSGPAVAGPPHNLPAQVTPFVGRERELARVDAMLANPAVRLVTITGPGGMGKTRLALAAAERQLARRPAGIHPYRHGIWFVPLAGLGDVGRLAPAVAASLGFQFNPGSRAEAQIQLIDHLRDKQCLVVADNFDHLVSGAGFLAELLATAPGVQLLVTSRERLKLQGEQLVVLEGLELPAEGAAAAGLLSAASARLFLNAARRAQPEFDVAEADAQHLARICRAVGGAPLALELAAAWTAALPPAEIAAGIERSLDFLAGEVRGWPARHQSIQAALDASWRHLTAGQQAAFRQLCVFRDGFTRPAAFAVADATLPVLVTLVHKSWLTYDPAGDRYHVHELLRQFGCQELVREPTVEWAARDRHSAYYLQLLHEREGDLKGPEASNALTLLGADIENIHAGWAWAVAHNRFDRLGPSAYSLATVCARSHRYEEGLAALDRAADRLRAALARPAPAAPEQLSAMAAILTWQCALHGKVGAHEKAEARGKEALALLSRAELDDRDTGRDKALVLSRVAWAYTCLDRTVEAERLLEESIRLLEAAGDTWELARASYYLSGVTGKRANFASSLHYARVAMELFEELGDRRWLARVEGELGYLVAFLGRLEEAEERMRASIKAFRQMGERMYKAMGTALLAEVLTYKAEFEEARAMAADSVAEHQQLGRRTWLGISHVQWCRASLHLGEYEAVLDRVPVVLALAAGGSAPMVEGNSRFLAGCGRLTRGEWEAAIEELEGAAAILRAISSQDYLCHTLSVLGIAHVLRRDPARARPALREAAVIAAELGGALFIAPSAAAGALLAAAAGDGERAVELYALACRDPFVATSCWYADVAGRWMDEVVDRLPAEVAHAALMRGGQLDLWATAEALAAELTPA